MESIQYTNYSTSISKEERSLDDASFNLLPRSVIRYHKPLLLDGEWRFELDAEDMGMNEKWYVHHDYKSTAHWPGSIEAHIAKQKALSRISVAG